MSMIKLQCADYCSARKQSSLSHSGARTCNCRVSRRALEAERRAVRALANQLCCQIDAHRGQLAVVQLARVELRLHQARLGSNTSTLEPCMRHAPPMSQALMPISLQNTDSFIARHGKSQIALPHQPHCQI